MDKRPEIRTRLTGFLSNEDGIMAVIFALCLPLFVVMAALAIDMGYSYWKRNTLQVDASASALAGAGRLMDDGIYDPVNEIVIFATVDEDGDGEPDNLDRDGDGVPDGAVVYIKETHRDPSQFDQASFLPPPPQASRKKAPRAYTRRSAMIDADPTAAPDDDAEPDEWDDPVDRPKDDLAGTGFSETSEESEQDLDDDDSEEE